MTRPAPNFFDILAAARRYRAGGAGPKATLLAIAERLGQVDEEWVCWPSMLTIASDSEQSVGTVRRHLAGFEEQGLVTRHSRGMEGGGRATNLLVVDVEVLMGYQSAHDARFGQSAHPGGAKRASEGGQSAHPGNPVPSIEVPDEAPRRTTRTTSLLAFDERFWPLYPLKVSKGAARVAWPRAVKKVGGDVDRIIDGLKRFVADPNRQDAFTPHPASWLNNERWDDEPLLPRPSNRSSPAPGNRITTEMKPGRVDV